MYFVQVVHTQYNWILIVKHFIIYNIRKLSEVQYMSNSHLKNAITLKNLTRPLILLVIHIGKKKGRKLSVKTSFNLYLAVSCLQGDTCVPYFVVTLNRFDCIGSICIPAKLLLAATFDLFAVIQLTKHTYMYIKYYKTTPLYQNPL